MRNSSVEPCGQGDLLFSCLGCLVWVVLFGLFRVKGCIEEHYHQKLGGGPALGLA